MPEFRDSTRILNQLASFHIFHSCTILVYHRTALAAASMCTPSVILDFCFILVTSNTVIWASLFGAHRFKLEVEDFIFHIIVFSRETFQTLALKFLLCIPQNFLGFYVFPYFVLVQYIVVQKLVKTYPRRVYTFCLFLFSGGM